MGELGLAATANGLGGSQTRASKLSFNDVIKRLAQQPEDSLTFISKKVHRPNALSCPLNIEIVFRLCSILAHGVGLHAKWVEV